eukprot:TRINITY_DN567_c0_g1_i4.p1 TRINITY_DN567_c0_g1~~TRINITY_DN567_c0_g1_i4.p1  ORF type:complete len:1648 (-),score=417.33 TRINITY_DN567_c0_g1_i4:86-5029(-)
MAKNVSVTLNLECQEEPKEVELLFPRRRVWVKVTPTGAKGKWILKFIAPDRIRSATMRALDKSKLDVKGCPSIETGVILEWTYRDMEQSDDSTKFEDLSDDSPIGGEELMKSIRKLGLKTFDGSQDFSDWKDLLLFAFNEELSKVSPEVKAKCIKFLLKGDALLVARDCATMEDMFKNLEEQFSHKEDVYSSLEWVNCIQGESSVNDFLLTLRKIGTQTKVHKTEKEILEKLKSGLRPDILVFMQSMELEENLHAYVEAAKRNEVLVNRWKAEEKSSHFPSASSSSSTLSSKAMRVIDSHPKESADQLEDEDEETFEGEDERNVIDDESDLRVLQKGRSSKGRMIPNSPRNQRCYACGEFGHFQFECKNVDMRKVRCFNCGNFGHFTKDCKYPRLNFNESSYRYDRNDRGGRGGKGGGSGNFRGGANRNWNSGRWNNAPFGKNANEGNRGVWRVSDQQEFESEFPINSQEKKEPDVKIEVCIGSNTTERMMIGVVDTGANWTAISSETAKQLHLSIHEATHSLQAANKEMMKTLGDANIHIEFNHQKVCMIVVIAEDLSCGLILGLDWMKSMDILAGYYHGKRAIFMGGKIIPQNENADRGVVWIKDDCQLLPNHSVKRIAICGGKMDTVDGIEKPKQVLVEIKNFGKNCVNLKKGHVCGIWRRREDQSEPSIELGKELPQWEPRLKLYDDEVMNQAISKLELNHVDPIVAEQVRDIFRRHSRVIALDSDHPGDFCVAEYQFFMKDENPIYIPQRRLNPKDQEFVDSEIKRLLENHIIEKSSSPYNSPIVVVWKNNKKRFCLDARAINARTVEYRSAMPLIDECLESLGGAKYYTVLDMKSGFLQITLSQKCRQVTAFTINSGPFRSHYHYCRLPFGLKSSPAIFADAMRRVLSDFGSSVQVFVDDIIVTGKDIIEHNNNLDLVLERLERCGMRLGLDKAQVLKEEVTYLGYKVSCDGIRIVDSRLDQLLKLKSPTNLEELGRICGLFTFVSKFIPDYSAKIKPLSCLKRKNTKFTWGPEQEESLNKLKEIFKHSPVLAYPNLSFPFIVSSDASKSGLGAALFQKQEGFEHPRIIMCASRGLRKYEENYSTCELEAVAMEFAFKKFANYILGRKFLFLTDNSVLAAKKWCSDGRHPTESHKILLSEYDYETKLINSKNNCIADLLSRSYQESNEKKANSLQIKLLKRSQEEIGKEISEGNWKQLQQEDEWGAALMEALGAGSFGTRKDLLEKAHNLKHDYTINERGVLYFQNTRLFVPDSCRDWVLNQIHTDSVSGGHWGRTRSIRKAVERFYWNGMTSQVAKFVKSCEICQRTAKSKIKGELQPITTDSPREMLTIDLTGELSGSKSFKYILVIIDNYSRYTVAVALKDQKAATVSDAIEQEWFLKYGGVKCIHSDKGANLMAAEIQSMLQRWSVQPVQLVPFAHHVTGMVERCISTIKNGLMKKQADWDVILQEVIFSHNSSVCSSTGYTPFELFFGEKVRLPVDVAIERSTGERSLCEGKEAVTANAEIQMEKARERNERNYNRKVVKPRVFIPGEKVLVYVNEPNIWWRGNRWEGPFNVLEQDERGNVKIDRGGRKSQIVHCDQVKKWIQRQNNETIKDAENETTPVVASSATAATSPLSPPPSYELFDTVDDEEQLYIPFDW